MINLFDYNKIMQKDTVIHCDTEEKAKKLLEWANSKGLRWGNGDSYIDICWKIYKENTGYNIFSGCFSPVNYFKRHNNTILTYEQVLLNDFDLIYKIETGDFGNRCETVYCVDLTSERFFSSKYVFEFGRFFYSSITTGSNSLKPCILIGSEKSGGLNILNKTEILSAFCELAGDKKWKVKVIYDGEESIFDGKTLPDRINVDPTPIYTSVLATNDNWKKEIYEKEVGKIVVPDSSGDINYSTGNTSTILSTGLNLSYEWVRKAYKLNLIDKDFKIINDTINKKGEDVKMAGKKADVEIVVVDIDGVNIKEIVRVSDEYYGYSINDKTVDIPTGELKRVKKLTIDGKVIFEYEITTTELDTIKDYIKYKMKLIELDYKKDYNLIHIDDYEIEKAKLLKEFNKYSNKVTYNVDWKLVK